MSDGLAYVTPEVLKWAREKAGLSASQVEGDLELDPGSISAWEAGQEHPPFSTAEKLAEIFHTPFGYLFLSRPPTDEYMNATTAYDERCENLARHFLPDGSAASVQSLAQTIQDAVEDWMSDGVKPNA